MYPTIHGWHKHTHTHTHLRIPTPIVSKNVLLNSKHNRIMLVVYAKFWILHSIVMKFNETTDPYHTIATELKRNSICHYSKNNHNTITLITQSTRAMWILHICVHLIGAIVLSSIYFGFNSQTFCRFWWCHYSEMNIIFIPESYESASSVFLQHYACLF